mmetsp:Transcript_4910/g.12002  ORF Transcript_4910/g.12002 Transcript_4910/m.12002 type:complete len:585 (+) Transcript_4910:122-1876(+)|eukprot:CAMPEP_0172395148 /NCGR_PEP_ID=MMETSP1061-20121228/18368_1 /TAXON_ID=37318 /ORGANISM="Pseudo-nitzschia pungens, Strain cf. pungens" /LENGTH=584 /DNA_ID=CAMNT_0013126639 /DNA_START=43 /DNA_END=1797 /DNA_ORIENTATION=-
MSIPYYNANDIPVVEGTYASYTTNAANAGNANHNPYRSNRTSLNHSINDAQISDAMARKHQEQIDQHLSYYAATDRDPKIGIFPLESTIQGDHTNADGSIPRGELQPRACRDVFWAVLFYAHVIAIGCVTVRFVPLMASEMASEYGGGAQRWLRQQHRRLLSVSSANDRILEDNGNDNDNDNDGGEALTMDMIWTILAVSGAVGLLVSSLAMSLMMAIPVAMIKMALIFNLLVTAAVFGFIIHVDDSKMTIPVALGFLLLTVYYTYIVWRRIPYAASTLVTALTAVKCNMGLSLFAYNNLIVTFVWSLWWSTAFLATFYVVGDCDAEGYCDKEINGGLVFLFLVSFFWTAQIIKNVVHTTVAGTVGTWWFVPGEARNFCSVAIQRSYLRSVTTSFGSICFGSLIVAIIQAMREMVRSPRPENQNRRLTDCVVDCIFHILDRVATYFNKWGFVYVGLYGYGFVEASSKVLSLFQARGWSLIIADYLVDKVLLTVSICVGIITGIIGAVLATAMEQDGAVVAAAFVLSTTIGFILCSCLFGLVSSAVNVVIVCFAEAPAEFQSNHPMLSQQMIDAWREAYPTEFGY